MPFQSLAQERWGHSPAGIKALGGKAKVAEWDSATKGRKLPARKKPAFSRGNKHAFNKD